MPDFLLEIGTEELPASYIAPALEQMAKALRSGLEEARLFCGQARTAATPRRLAIWVPDLPTRQTEVEVEMTGPPARVAFDADGNPTKAAAGFARAQGVTVEEIHRVQTPKGEYCAVRKTEKGRTTKDILGEVLVEILAAASFPKSMLWPETDRPFARPIRWMVALFGEEVVPAEAYGVKTGRSSEGHPFLSPAAIVLETADWSAYEEALRRGNVVIDIGKRRNCIREEIQEALAGFGGPLEEEWLVDEVTQLTQCPHVILGSFADEFLSVPAPVVVAAMTEHQRYFPVRNADGELCPHFAVVSDRGEVGVDTIRYGNERVLHARLADARFFFEQDRMRRLEDYRQDTAGMVFLKGLGTYRDKSDRMAVLVGRVCEDLAGSEDVRRAAVRAAELCKADLVTAMVGEFPKLQGIVGGIYADADGEPEGVGRAIAEHYMPRYASDALPSSESGKALSLAEKLDNLSGCFSLGLTPSGSADPYALRRQSQALLRIAGESGRFFNLSALVRAALDLLPDSADKSADTENQILTFLGERLHQLALDKRLPHDLVRAALAVRPDCVADFWLRLDTLASLAEDPVWTGLVEVAERTFNITRETAGPPEVKPELFETPEERNLWRLLRANEDEIRRQLESRQYEAACRLFADRFAGPVHTFFEKVFVNVENVTVRENRLALLKRLSDVIWKHVADLSQITTGIDKG